MEAAKTGSVAGVEAVSFITYFILFHRALFVILPFCTLNAGLNRSQELADMSIAWESLLGGGLHFFLQVSW